MKSIAIFLAVFLLSACGHFGSDFIEPSIDVVNIQLLPATAGFEQAIQIDFRLTNPNLYALPLKNLSYKLALDGSELVSGSSSKLSSIEANGSQVFSVEAHINFFRSALWLKKRMESKSNTMDYRVEANLDTGLLFSSDINVQREGRISLAQ